VGLALLALMGGVRAQFVAFEPEFGVLTGVGPLQIGSLAPLVLLDSSPMEPHGSEFFGSSDCSFLVPALVGLVGKTVPLQVLLVSVPGQTLSVTLTEQLKLTVQP
jgi:hypothetical protein